MLSSKHIIVPWLLCIITYFIVDRYTKEGSSLSCFVPTPPHNPVSSSEKHFYIR